LKEGLNLSIAPRLQGILRDFELDELRPIRCSLS
jgi:hypothetical protein